MTSTTATPATQTTAPTLGEKMRKLVAPPRIVGLDIARALAIIGMLGAHTAAVTSDLNIFDFGTWDGIIHGAPSLLFALLAGISLAIMTGGKNTPTTEQLPGLRLKIMGRAAVIFAIGVALEMLGTGVDIILCSFGVFYIALLPTLTWRARKLAVVATAIAVLGPPLLGIFRTIIQNVIGAGAELTFTGTYHATTWLPMMMIGMAIGRLDIRSKKVQTWMVGGGLIAMFAGYGLGMLGSAMVPELGDGSTTSSARSSANSASEEPAAMTEKQLAQDAAASMHAELDTKDPSKIDWSQYSCFDQGAGDLYCSPSSNMPAGDETADTGKDATQDDVELAKIESGWPALVQQMPGWDLPNAIGVASLSTAPHSGSTVEMLYLGGIATWVLGLFALIGRFVRWPLYPLAALGSMPLTYYALHVVVILILGGPMGTIASNSVWGWITLGMIITAPLLVALFGQGPLEKLAANVAKATQAKAVSK